MAAAEELPPAVLVPQKQFTSEWVMTGLTLERRSHRVRSGFINDRFGFEVTPRYIRPDRRGRRQQRTRLNGQRHHRGSRDLGWSTQGAPGQGL